MLDRIKRLWIMSGIEVEKPTAHSRTILHQLKDIYAEAKGKKMATIVEDSPADQFEEYQENI